MNKSLDIGFWETKSRLLNCGLFCNKAAKFSSKTKNLADSSACYKCVRTKFMIYQGLRLISFFRGSTATVGQGLSIFEVSRSHSDTPHSIALLRTSDQPVAGASTWETHNSRRRHIPIPPAVFIPAIPASERPPTYVLDREASGIGLF